jgi:hypothetical protein
MKHQIQHSPIHSSAERGLRIRSSEARKPAEAFVLARIGEFSGSAMSSIRRIEIDNGPKWWVSFHDPPPDFDRSCRTRELTRILLVFNCGRAEITSKEPIPKLISIPWESDGHYRFVGRIKEVIEPGTTGTNDLMNAARRTHAGSVDYGVIIDADIPLWCHFRTKDAGVKAGTTIDVSGELMGGPG